MKEGVVYNQDNPVAFIKLQGEPYQRTIEGKNGPEEVDCNVTLTNLANNTGYIEQLPKTVAQIEPHIRELTEGAGFDGIDKKLKHGGELSFDDAFSLATFVCAGLNKPLNAELAERIKNVGPHETHLLQATALLSAMSAKEGYAGLTPSEIAGVVAATIKADTVLRIPTDGEVLSLGGMGGDRGYPIVGGQSKLFSLSTLSSIALAVDGQVHKHHSYPNTAKVAGQSAIESLGARSDFHTPQAFEAVIQETGLVMSSCHDTRTLHTLSHLLRGETINHVIGPLSFTMSADVPLHGFIGVNEKVHPETVIEALQILDQRGYQRYANSAVYCGTDLSDVPDEMLDPRIYTSSIDAKEHVVVDEIAPPPYSSLVAFLVNGENMGTYVLRPGDFYEEGELAKIDFEELVIPNTREAILFTNEQAIRGLDHAKARYLAMTVGLGLFVRHDLACPDALNRGDRKVNQDYLRMRTKQAYSMLVEGDAAQKMRQYVAVTQQYAGVQA